VIEAGKERGRPAREFLICSQSAAPAALRLHPGQKADNNCQKKVGSLACTGQVSGDVIENIPAPAPGQDAAQLPSPEKRDSLARLLKRLAHEIRNPLSSLDVQFQLLEEDLAALAPQMRPPLVSRLGIIRGELQRLDSIVDRFLKLAGPSALELEPVQINKIVTHVCDLLRPEASTRKVEILATVEPDLPPVTADSVRLTQALLNIIINGIQAISGGGQVNVNAAKAGDNLSLRVQDSGPGIPPGELGDIFDPYFTTKPEGNGLGLWIAQQIAVAHGGDLHAENAPAGGAVFVLTLPLKRKD
jgi:two-component system sensor histidine kinase HydH